MSLTWGANTLLGHVCYYGSEKKNRPSRLSYIYVEAPYFENVSFWGVTQNKFFCLNSKKIF
jgi:hypothetical protein